MRFTRNNSKQMTLPKFIRNVPGRSMFVAAVAFRFLVLLLQRIVHQTDAKKAKKVAQEDAPPANELEERLRLRRVHVAVVPRKVNDRQCQQSAGGQIDPFENVPFGFLAMVDDYYCRSSTSSRYGCGAFAPLLLLRWQHEFRRGSVGEQRQSNDNGRHDNERVQLRAAQVIERLDRLIEAHAECCCMMMVHDFVALLCSFDATSKTKL